MHKLLSYKKDNYYEAIIQIRPRNNEVLDYVDGQLKKNNVFISKFIEKKFGYDLYITSKKVGLNIGKKLKKSFKGELKISKSLYSRDKQKSKDIYRITICFRLIKSIDL